MALGDMKKVKLLMMMMIIAVSLMWAGAADKRKQPKVPLKINKMIENNSIGSE